MNYIILVTADRIFTFYSPKEGDLTIDQIKDGWEKASGKGSFEKTVKNSYIHKGIFPDWEQD